MNTHSDCINNFDKKMQEKNNQIVLLCVVWCMMSSRSSISAIWTTAWRSDSVERHKDCNRRLKVKQLREERHGGGDTHTSRTMMPKKIGPASAQTPTHRATDHSRALKTHCQGKYDIQMDIDSIIYCRWCDVWHGVVWCGALWHAIMGCAAILLSWILRGNT